MLNRDAIRKAIDGAGLRDFAVCLHSSLRSFGRVEGGADAVIDAFIDAGCTLIVPAFTYECEAPEPPDRFIERNAPPPRKNFDPGAIQAYEPSIRPSPAMGAIPARVVERPGRSRGDHPLNSFAGLGPRAAEILATQSPMNVYGPFKSMYADSGSMLVLAGVGLNRATAVHYAEERFGRTLFRRWARLAGGRDEMVEVGSCSEGFENLAGAVAEAERRIRVGEGEWRLFSFAPFIDAVVAALRADPAVTHCGDPDCTRCNDAVKGGPLI